MCLIVLVTLEEQKYQDFGKAVIYVTKGQRVTTV